MDSTGFRSILVKKTHNRNVKKIAGLKQKQKRDINFKTTLRNFNSYFEILNKKVT